MRMIDKIMRSMRDTGMLDGMSDEDVDTLATAALEGMREPTIEMKEAVRRVCITQLAFNCGVAAWPVMIDAALNE